MRSSLATFSALLPVLLAGQQTITGSFLHNGILRDHRLYIPAAYVPGTAVPLVFNLHGYSSDNVQQEFYGDFRPIADTAHFLIVHPNGTIDGTGNRFWNTFGASAVDDLGYLVALLDTISTHYTVDPNRIYSTGMSNGGFMSHELACYASDRFAAIASVTGTMIYPHMTGCAATHPTPVMQIHGTADPTVNYYGGSGLVPVEELVLTWAQFNNCILPPMIAPVPNTVLTDGCTAEHWVYGSGDAGSTVELFKVLGGGHTWPGANVTIGVTNQDMDASNEIWRFFSRYRLDELQAGIDAMDEDVSFMAATEPSSNAVLIRFARSGMRSITLCDALGRAISSARTADREIRLQARSPGLVLVIVEEEGRRLVKRIVLP
ncbi:MAG: prolyl oligopeptidase family serine peptidase [Flavobacteriales bacterium]|nr:prolyl oligopeptidase family serine peptidase [Flavobacteriales bacterium]